MTASLTPEQVAAIRDMGDAAIIAAPGSGKTLVLVEKVASLVLERKIPLPSIALITFTEKAAAEFKGRLSWRLKMPVEELEEAPIGTIHSFFARLIRQFGKTTDFSVMEEPLARLMRHRISDERLLDFLRKRQPVAIRFVRHFGRARSIAMAAELASRAEKVEGEYRDLLREIRSAYERRKDEKRLFDFQDLEEKGLELLEDPGIRKEVQKSLRWILVDEFQDTNLHQKRLLERIHDPRVNRLAIVGDPRQSIYRFRGARPELFWRQAREIEENGGKTFHLDTNFRSDPRIIDYVNGISPRLFPDFSRPIRSRRQQAGLFPAVRTLTVDRVKTAEEQRREEARTVVNYLSGKNEAGEIALLFRTRRAMPPYEEALREAGIPFESSGGKSLFDDPSVIAVTFFLKKLAGEDSAWTRFAVENSPLRHCERKPPAPREPLEKWLAAFFEEVRPLFEKGRTDLLTLEKWLHRLLQVESPAFRELLSLVEILRRPEMQVLSEEKGLSPGAIRLLTVHASKGLEFPEVILCDLAARPGPPRFPYFETVEGKILFQEPSPEGAGLKVALEKTPAYLEGERLLKEAEQEEAKRLLYVAMTRAKDRLVLPLIGAPPRRPPQTWHDFLSDEVYSA